MSGFAGLTGSLSSLTTVSAANTSGLTAAIAGPLASILLRPFRAIGIYFPDVVIEENHRDDMMITEHPVEQGSAITDHAYKRPAEVIIRAGSSNSGNGEGYAQVCYAELLALQASRIPFEAITGKRVYLNMMLASLEVTTDASSEFALMVTAHLREVVIVQTQAASVPPADQQAMPQNTNSPVAGGTVTPVPTTSPTADSIAAAIRSSTGVNPLDPLRLLGGTGIFTPS